MIEEQIKATADAIAEQDNLNAQPGSEVAHKKDRFVAVSAKTGRATLDVAECQCPECGHGNQLVGKGAALLRQGNMVSIWCGGCDLRLDMRKQLVHEARAKPKGPLLLK